MRGQFQCVAMYARDRICIVGTPRTLFGALVGIARRIVEESSAVPE